MSTMVSKLQQRHSDIQEEGTRWSLCNPMANPIEFAVVRIPHNTDQERTDSNNDSIDSSFKHKTSWPCFGARPFKRGEFINIPPLPSRETIQRQPHVMF